jgi:hypothetical protein
MAAVVAWDDVYEITVVPAVMERPKKGLGWPSLCVTLRQPRYSPKCLEGVFSEVRAAPVLRPTHPQLITLYCACTSRP